MFSGSHQPKTINFSIIFEYNYFELAWERNLFKFILNLSHKPNSKKNKELKPRTTFMSKRARLRLFTKLAHLKDEVHCKTANHLCSEYDVILSPEFAVKQMTRKRGQGGEWKRRINRSTVRRMLLWDHYQFRMRLLAKAKQWGKTVVVVGEGYTSKTCGMATPEIGRQ